MGQATTAPACGLTGVLDEALLAFVVLLDCYTLVQMLAQKALLLSPLRLRTIAEPGEQT
jgi:Rrf2 family nitric oxide-sensitive transcriptional repressor